MEMKAAAKKMSVSERQELIKKLQDLNEKDIADEEAEEDGIVPLLLGCTAALLKMCMTWQPNVLHLKFV